MINDSALERFREFPKVELHRHLEGSIRLQTLLDIARQEKVPLPTYDPEKLRRVIQVNNDPPDFLNFLDKFKLFRGFYPNRQAIERIAFEVVEDAVQDHIKYLELRYSPTHFACGQRFPEEEVIRWIHGSLERAMETFDIEVIPLLTISRNYGIEMAEHTVHLAVKYAGKYFFGLDLAGDEINYPARPLAHLFKLAKDSGMGLTLHAGEAGGAENVIEAVEAFRCDRIGHGVKAAASERAMEIVKAHNVMLEICPTSNLHTGAVASLEAHPLRLFYEKGIPVCLNTDDPKISNITLSREYRMVVDKMGLSEEALKTFNRMALEHSFHPNREKLKARIGHLWD